MKFSVGDKILLKRTGEEGTVVAFISNDMIEVEVAGVVFPVWEDEVDHPYLKWFTEKNRQKKKTEAPEQLPVEKPKERQKRLAQGIYLSFMPVFKVEEMEDIVDHLKVYLLNEMPVAIDFRYEVGNPKTSLFQHEGKLHSFGNVYLHSIDWEEINDQPRFQWHVADADHEGQKPEEGLLKIKPRKLFDQINELLLKNEPTFSFQLVSDFVPLPPEEKEPPKSQKPQPGGRKQREVYHSFADLPRNEIDLHIDQLIKDFKKLSPGEILDIQLRALERQLHLAIMHRQERLVIIHGLGTGALKEAVHKLLRTYPEVRSFKNVWHGRYGFGSTEVIFFL